MKKKVLYLITKSNFGGAQRYVYDLATHLPCDEYDVAVAFGHAPDGKAGQLSRLLIAADIRTIVIPELSRDVHLATDWRAFSACVGLFKEEKPDIVHVNSSKAGGLGTLAARLCGVPRIVFTLHGLPESENRSRFSRTAIRFFTWLTILFSHRTITISNDAFQKMRTLPFVFKKVTLVHNGIETPPFESPSDAKKALRAIDPTIKEGLLVGTIAELHPNKSLSTAIDAIQKTDAHFVIIGDGELKEELVAYARDRGVSERVHFLGFIPHAARYLRAFDAFLLTSLKEGLPYVLLEAGAAHIPIVALDVGGVRDVILPEFTGLVPKRDPAQIAHALTRVLTDHALAHSLTKEMSVRVLTTFSLKQMLEKTRVQYDF